MLKVNFRIEWMWTERLDGEQEDVDKMRMTNRILLENILPSHVAHHFLSLMTVFIPILESNIRLDVEFLKN